MRHRVVWTYGVPPDPNALIRMPTWNVVTGIGGIETLRQLGSLDEANFKAAKSLSSDTNNNNHRLKKLTKRSQQSDKQSEQCSVPPKGPILTDSWSWMKSSARHTLSNQQAQVKALRLLI